MSEYTVLYIEDNPANMMLMERIVARLGDVELIPAHTAEIGIALAISKTPDLILMDINLPGMNGIEALGQLRATPKTSKAPVVAISAAAMPRDIERAEQAGFEGYLTKPIDVEKTIAKIRELLERGPA